MPDDQHHSDPHDRRSLAPVADPGMFEVHFRKLRCRDDISAEEEDAIRGMVAGVVEHPADRTIVHWGREMNESLLLLDGWLARMKDLPGGQRQITEVHVAGDFADLHGFTLKALDHDVVTLSRCRIAVVPHTTLKDVLARFPHLARVYWLMTNIDAAISREWTLSLGRRSALARMAHLFCELLLRLEVAGLTNGHSYEFPLTQAELGECLGLTTVHVNRTLQELRRLNLIQVGGRRVTIFDLDALKRVGAFDDQYLYLEKRPR